MRKIIYEGGLYREMSNIPKNLEELLEHFESLSENLDNIPSTEYVNAIKSDLLSKVGNLDYTKISVGIFDSVDATVNEMKNTESETVKFYVLTKDLFGDDISLGLFPRFFGGTLDIGIGDYFLSKGIFTLSIKPGWGNRKPYLFFRRYVSCISL